MLALYLLASHLVGDFVLQTRWQAVGKFDDLRLRERHCFTYGLAFVPVVVWKSWGPLPTWRCVGFLAALLTLHWLTDSRRFRSTLGDVVAWRLTGKRWEHREGPDLYDRVPRDLGRWPAPNPWEPLPILIDQTLHIVQLAALGWLLA